MKKEISILILAIFALIKSYAQSADLELKKVSDKIYVYTAWSNMGEWGRVASNGLVVLGNHSEKAMLVDTPTDEKQTLELLKMIKDSLKADVSVFVPGHWHSDCVGGMEMLNKLGIKTYANKLTNDILRQQEKTTARYEFKDSLTIDVGGTNVNCHFLGGGHTVDNIIVWVPKDKVLFGGCMLKDNNSTSVGNYTDAAPFEEWIRTVDKVEKRFHDAKVVIPGHGNISEISIIKHTKELLNNMLNK